MDKIIDIHTHILPGVDDGAKSINDSLEIIDYLKSVGITDMVLTSHYIKGTNYNFNVLTRAKIINELRKEAVDKGVNLYLGNEVFLCDEVLDLLEKHEIYTINNSNYMLIELPLSNYMKNFASIICELNDYGIIPIIAHPERYSFIQKDKNRIGELVEFNCLLQINVDSLIGKYGRKAKKISKWLLKKNAVSIVATDTHYVSDPKKLIKAYKKLKKIVGEDKYKELVYYNPKRILENKELKGNFDCFRKEQTW